MSDTFYIGVYLANRAFGGNEEGGWWYDCGELEYTIKKTFDNVLTAIAHAKELQRELDKKYNNRSSYSDLNSVLCNGNMQAQVHETEPPEFYPKQKPQYC